MTPNNNECQAEDGLNFNFSYDSTTDKHGYMDSNGTFIPFESGGIDTSDATAYARNIELGYTAYCRGEKIVGTAVIEHGNLIKYPGNIEYVSPVRSGLMATNIGDYALFAGGSYSTVISGVQYNTACDNIDIYNTSLTRSSSITLSQPRTTGGATNIGNYALVAGGAYYDENYNYIVSNTVDAYDTSLTRSIPTTLTKAKYSITSAHNSSYAIFYQGFTSGSGTLSNDADAYNSSLTKSIPQYFSGTGHKNTIGGNIGNYALFSGGRNSADNSWYINTFYLNNSLTFGSASGLSYAKDGGKYTSIGNYALIGGGSSNVNDGPKKVETYNASLTRGTATDFTYNNYSPQATTIDGYFAIFVYGGSPSYASEIYNASLVKSTAKNLSSVKNAATSIDTFALFAANNSNNGSVEAYCIS